MTVLYFPGPIDITGYWRRPIPPADIEGVIADLTTRQAKNSMTPAERALVADPEWLARHRAWLATPEGEEYRAWQSRPWAEISAELRAEHIAEREGRHPGATRGRGVITDFHDD